MGCKPLLDAATKDVFRQNVFRITGLPVDATPREIAKHADRLKMMEELGQGASAHTGVFSLNPPPGVDQIREAIQNLKDPERRLVDEFFWFWPREFGKSASDPALLALAKGDLQTAYDIWGSYEEDPRDGVVATHNKALTTQIIALDWEKIRAERSIEQNQAAEIENYWKRSFRRWEKLVDDDRLWDRVAARVRQVDDPRLRTGFVRRMRASLPEALDKINAELALSYAEAGKLDLARLHIQFMRDTNQGLDNVEKTAELVLTPVKVRLREQIKRAEDKLQRAPTEGPQTAKQLLDEAEKCVRLFDLFFGSSHEGRNDLFDEVASVCNLLVVAYHKATQDDTTCLAILKAALPLATAIDLRGLLEKNIGIFGGNIRIKEADTVYQIFKSIQEADESAQSKLDRFEKEAVPAMMKIAGITGTSASFGLLGGHSPRDAQLFNSAAIVLRGISTKAWNDDRDTETAKRGIELALQYARDTELRKRLQDDKQTLDQLVKRQAAEEEALRLEAERQEKERRRKRKIGWAVAAGIVGLLIIGNLSSENRNSTGSISTATPAPQQPSSYAPPLINYSPSSGAGGKVYRVPSYMDAELRRESQAIDAQEAILKDLRREIEAESILLDDTSQYAVDQFNGKVRRYNAMRLQFNQMVNNYNEKLQRYGR
jgi:hypothetical protein